jgi:hypothetical protein
MIATPTIVLSRAASESDPLFRPVGGVRWRTERHVTWFSARNKAKGGFWHQKRAHPIQEGAPFTLEPTGSHVSPLYDIMPPGISQRKPWEIRKALLITTDSAP